MEEKIIIEEMMMVVLLFCICIFFRIMWDRFCYRRIQWKTQKEKSIKKYLDYEFNGLKFDGEFFMLNGQSITGLSKRFIGDPEAAGLQFEISQIHWLRINYARNIKNTLVLTKAQTRRYVKKWIVQKFKLSNHIKFRTELEL